jgi:hypothetical protein
MLQRDIKCQIIHSIFYRLQYSWCPSTRIYFCSYNNGHWCHGITVTNTVLIYSTKIQNLKESSIFRPAKKGTVVTLVTVTYSTYLNQRKERGKEFDQSIVAEEVKKFIKKNSISKNKIK